MIVPKLNTATAAHHLTAKWLSVKNRIVKGNGFIGVV
jgi:hypothetical protein